MKKTTPHSGAHYFKTATTFTSSPDSQYHFKTFSGSARIQLEAGDSCFYLSDDKKTGHCARGPKEFTSKHFCTVIRGYAPPEKSIGINTQTNLPYVNGCSTRQLFAPERPGDPTWQMLKMPAGTKEQMHHIHPTARAVYVLSGQGVSVVGNSSRVTKTVLTPGMVCILEPMCSHHFETSTQDLIVLPVHIWSSIPGLDFQHPMFNGTLQVDF